jgi:hypothetical protein
MEILYPLIQKIFWVAPFFVLVLIGLRFMVDFEDFNLGWLCRKAFGDGAPVAPVTIAFGALLIILGVLYGIVYVYPIIVETAEAYFTE